MRITLNAQQYEIQEPLLHFLVQEFSTASRNTTQQKRSDRALLSSWEIRWERGIGFRRLDSSPTQGVWSSFGDTRWQEQIVLPPLPRTVTRPATMDSIRGVVTFLGLATALSLDGTADLYFQQYTKSTRTWAGTLIVAAAGRTPDILDIAQHSQYVIALVRDDSGAANEPNVYRWDGTTMSAVLGVALPADSDDHAVIISHLGDLYTAIKRAATGLVQVSKSTDDGSNFSNFVSFTSNNPPIGRASYWDHNGNVGIWLATADNLYLVDTTNTKLIPLNVGPFLEQTAADDCGMNILQVHQGRLYAIGERMVYEFFWNGNTLVQTAISPPFEALNALIPSGTTRLLGSTARLTGATSMGKWLVIGTESGNTTDRSLVLCYDPEIEGYEKGRGAWHVLTSNNPSANIDGHVLGFVDSTLHYTIAANTLRVVEDTDKDPISVSGYGFDTVAIVWTPHFTGGMQEFNARWLQIVSDNESMSADETIVAKYGLNYANPVTSWGTLNNVTTSLNLGSNLGVAAKVFGVEFTLNRLAGTNTLSPRMHSPVMYFEKIPTRRNAFGLLVDVEASADPGRAVKQVQDDLATVLDSVPLVVFKFIRGVNEEVSYNVAPIPEWEFSYLTGSERALVGEEKAGSVRLFLAERI